MPFSSFGISPKREHFFEKPENEQCPNSCVPDATVRAGLQEIKKNPTSAERYTQLIAQSCLCKSGDLTYKFQYSSSKI